MQIPFDFFQALVLSSQIRAQIHDGFDAVDLGTLPFVGVGGADEPFDATRHTIVVVVNGTKGVDLGLGSRSGLFVYIDQENIESLALPLSAVSLAAFLVAVTELFGNP